MAFPVVGRKLVHFLGRSDDQEQLDKDKQNPMWERVQDGVRPAWAPDLFRLGYCVAWKREGLPKLAIKLGIKNPEKLKSDGISKFNNGKRLLTFDDVWIVGITPTHRPFGMPATALPPEEWWLSVNQISGAASPYVVPGGGEIVVGAQRLADVVSEILSTPHGYPRIVPGLDEMNESQTQVVNPMIPRLVVRRNEPDLPGTGGELDQFAGLELFRY